MLFFLAEKALASPNCFSEIRTAARLNKPILVIRLDESVPDDAWRELLTGRPEVPRLDTAGERAEAVLSTGFVGKRFRHGWTESVPWRAVGLAASLLLFLAAAAALAALATGRWSPLPRETALPDVPEATPAPTPVPVLALGEAEKYFAVSFPDPQQESAARKALGMAEGEIQRWNLAEIKTLVFCGNMVLKNTDAVRFDKDGTCRVNGAPVSRGKVSDLRLMADMAGLEELSLICQPLTELSGLNGLVRLRELSLAGSAVSDLSSLGTLPGLESLHLEHSAVRDLRPLRNLPALKTVTVSLDMLPLQWEETKPFMVVLVNEA